jgi:two-component system NtrC family response regulator
MLDMRLPDGDGLDLLTRFQELVPEIQVVIITAFADVNNAVEAMKLGAYDYITKPFDLDRLERSSRKPFSGSLCSAKTVCCATNRPKNAQSS